MDILMRMQKAAMVRDHYAGRFPLFLHDYFAWLGFDLTAMQLDIGEFIADETELNKVVMAQRGEAKSTIAIARALHKLVVQPSSTVLFVSGSDDYAGTLSHAVVTAIMQWDRLDFLCPERVAGARTSYTEGFDIHHAFRVPDKQPTIKAVGIFGQLQGNHVTLLIADDVETTSNGMSPANRGRIASLTKEFSAIVNDGGEILYLGTPQTQDSIYNQLPGRGFVVRIWPGRYPTAEEEARYGGMLAPYVARRCAADPSLRTGHGLLGNRGAQTDPQRYTESKMLQNERDYQQHGYQLQYMLDTSMADALRQRLSISDLIIFDGSTTAAPETIHWASNPRFKHELPMDYPLARATLYRAADFSDAWRPYDQIIAFLDPAGGGGDESVVVVCASLGPYIHVLGMYIYREGGQSEENIAACVEWLHGMGVPSLVIEDNMGHGAVTNMYRGAVLRAGYRMGVEGVYSTMQKEKRILAYLGPVMQRHRLVMHQSVITTDYETCRSLPDGGREFCLLYQIQNMTPDRECIPHNDRVDALASAVNRFVAVLEQDEDKAAEERRQQAHMAFISNPMGYDDPGYVKRTTSRGTRRRLC